MLVKEREIVQVLNPEKPKRNYGVDLLRILSMFLVVLLHVIGNGGILGSVTPLSANYLTVWFVEIAAFCAVNCYGLISGYVGYSSRFKYSSIIQLYLNVVFYTLTVTAVFAVAVPGSVNFQTVVKAFIPFAYGSNEYWYFTAYFCAFFFFPYLKKLADVLERKEFKRLVVTAVLLFSVLPTLLWNDIFYVKLGYTPLWLALLYLIGAYIKKFEIGKDITALKCIFGFLSCVVLTWVLKIGLDFAGVKKPEILQYTSMLVQYTSPTVLFSAIFLLIMCSKLKINSFFKKLTAFFSPLAFSVYLIHCEPLIWSYVLAGRFAEYGACENPAVLVLKVVFAAFMIWFLCSLTDLVRYYIFKWCRIKELTERIFK